ncbi:unnamed protein product [Nezara viridula]|uniref:Ankyrin repeat protein n=1 Tax=Nezara viridula TaxID=85310 RepID=A0A9P0MJC9_NEZVI|nr:unnamed protein product [Nezara viridula]
MVSVVTVISFFFSSAFLLQFSSCRSIDENSQLASALKQGDIERARVYIRGGALDDFSGPKNREKIYSKLRTVQFLLSNGITRINTQENDLNKDPREEGAFDVVLIPKTSLITRMVVNITAVRNWGNKTVIIEGGKPIHLICLLPDVSPRIVQIILENGSDDVNTIFDSGATPLMLAVINGNLEVVKFLVERGARVNDTGSFPIKGVKLQEHFILSKLFSKTELNVEPYFNYSALIFAILSNNLDVIGYLLSKGADVNNKGKSWVMLYHGVLENKKEIVEILLRNGINVNGKDFVGSTALHKAVDLGNIEMARLLLKYGANLNATDALGWMPIHVASFKSKKHGKEMIQFLVQSGSSINAVTDGGYSPLNLVEVVYDPSFLSFLFKNIDSLNQNRHYSHLPEVNANETHTDIVNSVIRLGASLNHQDEIFGWSTLHWAAASGDLDTAKLLVKYGAMVSSRSKMGLNPYETAQYFGRKKVAEFLKTAKDLVQ